MWICCFQSAFALSIALSQRASHHVAHRIPVTLAAFALPSVATFVVIGRDSLAKSRAQLEPNQRNTRGSQLGRHFILPAISSQGTLISLPICLIDSIVIGKPMRVQRARPLIL
jgi:hypothetical protein